jgi:signal transduction histidine kinase
MAFYSNKKLGLILGLCALVVAGVWVVMPMAHSLSVKRIQTATLWQTDSSGDGVVLQNIEEARGEDIALPYFASNKASDSLTRWAYTIEVPLPKAVLDLDHERSDDDNLRQPAYGLLLMQLINGGDFYLNGTWLAGLPRSTEKERYAWYRPMLIPLPQHLLKNATTATVVAIQATRDPFLFIGAPYVGRMDDLHLLYETAFFLSMTLTNASHLFCFAVGLLMIGVWLVSPKEKVFALAGSIAVLWTLLFILLFWPHFPAFTYVAWRWLLFVCMALLAAAMPIFVFAFIQKPLTLLATWFLCGCSCVTPFAYAMNGSSFETWAEKLWLVPMLCVYIYAIWELALYGVRTRCMFAIALFIQSLVFCALIFHDYAAFTTSFAAHESGYDGEWRWLRLIFEPIHLTHFSLPLLLFVMWAVLLWQYRSHVKQVAHSDAYLKESLQMREQELTATYEEQMRLKCMESAHKERERIYQDVHDGIGSRLIATLFNIRKAMPSRLALEAQLQSCLDDLRLIINTRLDDCRDIQSAVFDYCLTIEAQIEGSHLSIEYEVSEGPAINLLPQVHTDVLRILQEAIANVIKHSGATVVRVKFAQTQAAIILSIADNGVGLPRALNAGSLPRSGSNNGRGLSGLLARAQRIGGTCAVSRMSPGTKIELTVPLTKD